MQDMEEEEGKNFDDDDDEEEEDDDEEGELSASYEEDGHINIYQQRLQGHRNGGDDDDDEDDDDDDEDEDDDDDDDDDEESQGADQKAGEDLNDGVSEAEDKVSEAEENYDERISNYLSRLGFASGSYAGGENGANGTRATAVGVGSTGAGAAVSVSASVSAGASGAAAAGSRGILNGLLGGKAAGDMQHRSWTGEELFAERLFRNEGGGGSSAKGKAKGKANANANANTNTLSRQHQDGYLIELGRCAYPEECTELSILLSTMLAVQHAREVVNGVMGAIGQAVESELQVEACSGKKGQEGEMEKGGSRAILSASHRIGMSRAPGICGGFGGGHQHVIPAALTSRQPFGIAGVSNRGWGEDVIENLPRRDLLETNTTIIKINGMRRRRSRRRRRRRKKGGINNSAPWDKANSDSDSGGDEGTCSKVLAAFCNVFTNFEEMKYLLVNFYKLTLFRSDIDLLSYFDEQEQLVVENERELLESSNMNRIRPGFANGSGNLGLAFWDQTEPSASNSSSARNRNRNRNRNRSRVKAANLKLRRLKNVGAQITTLVSMAMEVSERSAKMAADGYIHY